MGCNPKLISSVKSCCDIDVDTLCKPALRIRSHGLSAFRFSRIESMATGVGVHT